MYIPAHDRMTDISILHAFMRQNSFAILCASGADGLAATHLPLILRPDEGPHGTLYGHVAIGNRAPQGSGEVLAIFHGPHAYVSPTYYGEPETVPTWLYAVVHAYGLLQKIEGHTEALKLLREMTAFYETSLPEPWQMNLRPELQERLLGGISAFKIPISRLEGKWKLNRHHSPARRARTIAALENSKIHGDREIAALMRAQTQQT